LNDQHYKTLPPHKRRQRKGSIIFAVCLDSITGIISKSTRSCHEDAKAI
jgi:hypothetical protein